MAHNHPLRHLATALHDAEIGCWYEGDESGCLRTYSEHNIPNTGDEWTGTMHDKDAQRILANWPDDDVLRHHPPDCACDGCRAAYDQGFVEWLDAEGVQRDAT